ncbi:hypothetical protein JTL96_37250, partial [Pseudomonas aeruginosa]|nr:hypothetical protein [Pseudomonas aeruginosa]
GINRTESELGDDGADQCQPAGRLTVCSVHSSCPDKLTAATIAKAPHPVGEKGMNCHQRGMKCINVGMNGIA